MRRQGRILRHVPWIFAGTASFLLLSVFMLHTWTQTLYDSDAFFSPESDEKAFSGPVRAQEPQEDSEIIRTPQQTRSLQEDWRLILVNAQHPMPQDYEIELTQLRNGHAIDSRAYPDLQAMMDACRAEGLSPLICSSYRDEPYQRTLYENKVAELSAGGLSGAEAQKAAAQIVAPPGTSEHQTGLAVDIVDMDYQLLDQAQEDTPVGQWMLENSWRYGFILRYPSAHSGCTGIDYEPWHYRYVGLDAAEEIYEQGLCLEEYLALQSCGA